MDNNNHAKKKNSIVNKIALNCLVYTYFYNLNIVIFTFNLSASTMLKRENIFNKIIIVVWVSTAGTCPSPERSSMSPDLKIIQIIFLQWKLVTK